MELVPDSESGDVNCQETWERTPQLVYGSFLNITQFIIPIITIIVCYTKIIIRLQQRARTKPGTRSARQRQEEAARNARINKMLISMVIIFGISWFPINLINLVADLVDLGEYNLNEMNVKTCKDNLRNFQESMKKQFFSSYLQGIVFNDPPYTYNNILR